MSRKIFITGTGTDVGKTYVTGLILKKLQQAGLSAAYYKAAVSGNERDAEKNLIPGDARWVKEVSGIPQDEQQMCPYIYEAAYSPHLASRIEGNPIRRQRVIDGFSEVTSQWEYVTMEGSGGILCPLDFDTEELYLWELVKELDLSCLIVADAGLGTINNVALTVFFMKEKGIPVKGIIFNHYHPGNVMEEDNLRMCEHLTGIKVIACVKDGDTDLEMDAAALAALYD